MEKFGILCELLSYGDAILVSYYKESGHIDGWNYLDKKPILV